MSQKSNRHRALYEKTSFRFRGGFTPITYEEYRTLLAIIRAVHANGKSLYLWTYVPYTTLQRILNYEKEKYDKGYTNRQLKYQLEKITRKGLILRTTRKILRGDKWIAGSFYRLPVA